MTRWDDLFKARKAADSMAAMGINDDGSPLEPRNESSGNVGLLWAAAELRAARLELAPELTRIRRRLAPTRGERAILLTALEERQERLDDGPPATLCHPDEESLLPALIEQLRDEASGK